MNVQRIFDDPFFVKPCNNNGWHQFAIFCDKGLRIEEAEPSWFSKNSPLSLTKSPPKESVPFTPSWVGKDMVIPIKWRCHRSYNRWIIWKPKKWAHRIRPDVFFNIEPNKKNLGGVFEYFWNFHTDPWGNGIHFDLFIFFKWVGEPTTNKKIAWPFQKKGNPFGVVIIDERVVTPTCNPEPIFGDLANS